MEITIKRYKRSARIVGDWGRLLAPDPAAVEHVRMKIRECDKRSWQTLRAGIAGSELRLRLRRGDMTAIWRELHRHLQGHPVG